MVFASSPRTLACQNSLASCPRSFLVPLSSTGDGDIACAHWASSTTLGPRHPRRRQRHAHNKWKRTSSSRSKDSGSFLKRCLCHVPPDISRTRVVRDAGCDATRAKICDPLQEPGHLLLWVATTQNAPRTSLWVEVAPLRSFI